MTTRKPPVEVVVDNDDVCHMNHGDIPTHIEESELAREDLDDPTRVDARKNHLDGIQQKLDLNVPGVKPIKKVKPPTTTLGMLFRMERAKRGWTHTDVADQVYDRTGYHIDRRDVGRIEQGKPAVPPTERMDQLIALYGMDRKSVYEIYYQIRDLVIAHKKVTAATSKSLPVLEGVQQTMDVDINDIMSTKEPVSKDDKDLIGTPTCGCVGPSEDLKELIENANNRHSGMTPQEERAAYVTPLSCHQDRLDNCSYAINPNDASTPELTVKGFIEELEKTESSKDQAPEIGVYGLQSIPVESRLGIKKPQFLELLFDELRRLSGESLADIAKKCGMPVVWDSMFETFRLDLHAFCPFCGNEIVSTSMSLPETIMTNITMTCIKCQETVQVPFSTLIKRCREGIKIPRTFLMGNKWGNK